MALKVESFHHEGVDLEFVRKGRSPSWLIHTGTHGNESGVIASVEKFLEGHFYRMPDFLFVPEVSPSAVKLGTRRNKWGNDVNRKFVDETDDPEVRANLKLLERMGFQVAIFIHEDPDLESEFYVYDSVNVRGDQRLRRMFEAMSSHGAAPFTGLDEPKTPDFACHIQDGYYSEVEDRERRAKFPDGDGTAMDYFGRQCLAGLRRLTPEIPGRADPSLKDLIVADFFEYMIRWWYGRS